MAFDTLGVNVVANGIRGVAGDIGHLALSFLRYVRAVQQADKASIKTAASQSKLADTMAGKAQRNVSSLEKRYVVLTSRVRTLQATIQSLNLTMRDPASAKSNYDRAIEEVKKYENAIKSLEATARRRKDGEMYVVDARKLAPALAALRQLLDAANVELNKQAKNYAASTKEQARYTNATAALAQALKEVLGVEEELPKARQDAADATQKATDSQLDWAETVAAASNQTGIFGRLLSDLTGGFGAAAAGNSAFAAGLGVTVPQLGAVMVAMDALKLGVRLAQAAFNAFVAVVRTVWNVLKKLVGIVWDVATAIGKTLWNAVKKIASAPFNLVSKLFGNMGGSMQRVMEMAIGMNLSRVWWQLGMKIRDMAKMASDAAVDYQVTFNRLQALIKNEIISSYGRDITADEYTEATRRAVIATEELVKWTSKLAVSTIYNAEDILNVYTLAMSYGFASTQAEKLTEAVLDFASGMGLGDTEMKRVIENFGQMRAQGKITGTELRDLARGAFVPVNEVLEEMAKNAGLIGDYDIPNMQSISAVLAGMAENGELTADAFAAINVQLGKLGADGKITRQEFEGLVQDLSQSDVMAKFGLTAEQAGLALEGIKTGALTADLNELIKTGKLTIDEFFEAFIEIVTNKYPNAARSMGLTMKAVKSNISDFISTMIGWRLIAPVFEVVAKHTQDFIQNVLMSDKQIASFDRMGKAFKVVTELLMTYSTAMRKASNLSRLAITPFSQVAKVFKHLTDIIGALGTEEFSFKNVQDFSFLLKAFGMSAESRKTVTTGILALNGIMADIMAGVEIDPKELGKSLDDVFGTLWRDFFGPKIRDGIQAAWTRHIKPAIGRLWKNMKDKFGEWKVETLIPGIKTFFGETLPGWISGISKWLQKNGPKIITDIGTFVSDILAEFEKISAINFGEDHPLTLLLGVLKNLVKYGTVKIADPTSEVNQENLDKFVESLTTLKDTLKVIATEKLFEIEGVQKFTEMWNRPGAQALINSYIELFETLKTVFALNTGPIVTLFETISGVSIAASGGDAAIGMALLVRFLDGVAAAMGLIGSIPSFALTVLMYLEQFIVSFAQAIGDFEWNPDNNILINIGDFLEAVQKNQVSSRAWEGMVKAFDGIAGLVAKILGLDARTFREKLRDIFNGIREYFGLDPIEFAPLKGDVDLEVTPKIFLPEGYSYTVNPDGSITVTEVPTLSGAPHQKEPVVVDVPVAITPTATLPNGTKVDGDNWLDAWLTNNWVGPAAVPLSKDLKTLSVNVEISPTTDAALAGSNMAIDFSGGFSTTVATEMSAIDIPIPEITAERRRETSENATTMVADIANVFSSDTSIASAGSEMMGGFMSAIIAASSDAQEVAVNIASDLASPLNGLSGTFTSAGANAVQGMWNGMASVMDALILWWEGKVEYLNSIMPNMTEEGSPSKLYYRYGAHMMEGLRLGLESGQEGAVAQMHDAAIELRQALGAINTGTISPQQYNNVSNTTNWNVNVTTPLVASTPIQAYEILRMRAR